MLFISRAGANQGSDAGMPGGSNHLESPNFGFLGRHDAVLVHHAALAERFVFDDPNTALIKLRQFSELLAKAVAARIGVDTDEKRDFLQILNDLWDTGVLSGQVSQLFHAIRKAGNEAVNSGAGDRRQALHMLRMGRELAVWFHRTFGKDKGFKAGRFVPPPDPVDAEAELVAELALHRKQLAEAQSEVELTRRSLAEQEQLRQQAEELAARAYAEQEAALELAQQTEEQLATERQEFSIRLEELIATSAQLPQTERDAERQGLLQLATEASVDIELDEAATRVLIDQQLREAGWEADSVNIRHSKRIRPTKHRNLAIAEWPTASGPADYVLFVGLMPVATVEAKRANKNVAAVIEQARRYSKGLAFEDEFENPGGPWGAHRVPFLFSANGREYLAQLAEESGIWFHDVRHPNNHPHPLTGWYTPQGLKASLAQDIARAEERLASESPDYLPLRPYQQEAIQSVEGALAKGDRSLLLAMATGTGKTRTCIGLIYRLIKAGRFRRVLFLVDRTSLGEQAGNAFKDVRLENHQTFSDIYDMKEIGTLRPDEDTRLHLATVQSMVARILNNKETDPPIPVDAYDLIVVDECHRGYTLDSELTEGELQFRSEADYISKYRRVIEHFEAVRVGLTATPALHTTEIFGAPVFNYSYRQAVIDGYLSDHEPPFRISTQLGTEGIKWEQGEEVQVYNTKSRQLDLFRTEDEIKVEIEEFNRSVITENFNSVICQELVNHIDFDGPEKTLIYCVDDRHADLVVRLLKDALDDLHGGFPDDAVQKITGKADKPLQLIRRFKNEYDPRVAVTVDLLTTGIDVPAITNLVFLRRIRSRILFDQMMGRATRLCPDLYGEGKHKRAFRVFDAVDLYPQLQKLTDMQPVVARPKLSFSQLVNELQTVDDEDFQETVREELLGKLRRKRLSDNQAQQLQSITGLDPASLCEQLRDMTGEEIGQWFADRGALVELLDEKVGDGRNYLVSDDLDGVLEVARGYGTAKKPEDYLEAFRKFIIQNQDEITALKLVTTRPSDLTRQDLRELRLKLDEEGFTPESLRVAVRETTNRDIAASIIGYIRHVALGSPLVAHADRVKAAVEEILSSRSWNVPQRKCSNASASSSNKKLSSTALP